MTGNFAKDTVVPVAKSRAEIEALLTRYGADTFASGWDANRATIGFRCRGRFVRFTLTMPALAEFKKHPRYKWKSLTDAQAQVKLDQEMRRRWRALALVIKAKLEAVATGITTFEEEFLAHIVLPDGDTVGAWMAPQVEAAYSTGKMPSLLPAPEGR